MKIFLSLLLWFVYRLWGINGLNKLLLISGGYTASILRKFGAEIGNNDDIHSPLIIHNAKKDYANLVMGEHCHISKDVFFDLKDKITIESYIAIGMRTTILTHTGVVPNSPLEKKLPYCQAPVIIKNAAYIGAGVIILKGVTIGEESIVAAGAVVTHDIPPHSIVGGIPAKVIGSAKVQDRKYLSKKQKEEKKSKK